MVYIIVIIMIVICTMGWYEYKKHSESSDEMDDGTQERPVDRTGIMTGLESEAVVDEMSVDDKVQKYAREMIEKFFKRSVRSAQEASGGLEMIEGVMVFQMLERTYETLRFDVMFMHQCGLTDDEYQRILKEVLDDMGHKYVYFWSQANGTQKIISKVNSQIEYL